MVTPLDQSTIRALSSKRSVAVQFFSRTLRRGGIQSGRASHPRRFLRILNRRAKRVGLDPREYSAHPLRPGSLASDAERRARLDKTVEVTRHRTAQLFSVHPWRGISCRPLGRRVPLQPVTRGTYRRLVGSSAPCSNRAPQIGGLGGVELRSRTEVPIQRTTKCSSSVTGPSEDTPESIASATEKGDSSLRTVMTRAHPRPQWTALRRFPPRFAISAKQPASVNRRLRLHAVGGTDRNWEITLPPIYARQLRLHL